ncbi:glutamate decarboxylase [Cordyceps fumosorosea ARSEF 2679]|uniref:Glutamate decarboxylase n=1 Tax=Cordyceps fumosorosea (strain ARSEF 2679) TaxID=1081104 RepID=A0A162M9D5_CORFA|nr:glutamate decarboxylase [Cordyceps fumosorosea ARSEF 2679]OAA52860.1 glutamate decarboxylase [Cordyceps fumosorosea ARSEF 2679]
MVHLTRVQTGLAGAKPPKPVDNKADPKAASATAENLHHSASQLRLAEYNDEFTTSVYGSRFAREDLPKDSMPEGEMPKEVAYQMIKDQLSLDGNPKLKYTNLASFVSTYMVSPFFLRPPPSLIITLDAMLTFVLAQEQEALNLMADAFPTNFIDYEEYPYTADIQNRCVSMIANLFHAPADGDAIGTSTVGSSEAIMLAVLAMKRRWKQARQAAGKPTEHPNIIMSSAVQVCWEKAARYFEIDEKYVDCTRERFVIDPEAAVALVDENTIGIVSILGTTYTGHYEDTKAINDLLVKKNIDCPIHVDAASGGFVAPFVVPDLEWDFRLPKVVSINVSGHKYGLVHPGVGWAVWRSCEHLPKDLIFNINYLGAEQSSFTLNFSKGASQVIGQYYQLIRLGKHGYRAIMSNLVRTADHLSARLQELGFVIMSETSGGGLPLVAFRFPEGAEPHAVADRAYDEFALAAHLRARGWIVPAYTMAPKTEGLKMLRVVCREDFSRSRADDLIADVKLCLGVLASSDKETLERAKKYVLQHVTAHGKRSHKHTAHAYKDEKHSLQGKSGKTHAIC